MEREKWDRYYAALPIAEADESIQRFNAELLACISELLPPGSRILESGCGGGWQSLELARSGRYKVSLMDFSQNALTYARQLFEREELCAELIHGDVVEPGEPEFDLVFNSGVLEHYRFEEQVAFLRGMASRSRNLVLVLVPNRQCYWYWLSRVERSSKQLWPFGKEVPLIDLSSAFKVAGLQYLGRTYMGETWTEVFVNSLPGIADELREIILAIHRSPLIVKEQKCYLLAALGAVGQEVVSVPARWTSHDRVEDLQTAELSAALADALALAVGEQNRRKERTVELLTLEMSQQRAAAQSLSEEVTKQAEKIAALEAQVTEKEQAIQRRSAQVEERERIIRARDEAVARLQAELQESTAATERNGQIIGALTQELSHQRAAAQSLSAELTAQHEKITALAAQVTEREQAIQWRSAQVEEREKIIRARDEAIAWLREEVAQARRQIARMTSPKGWLLSLLPDSFRVRLQRATFPLRHPVKWVELQRGYWQLRSRVRRALVGVLPLWARNWIKGFRKRKASDSSIPHTGSAMSELELRHQNVHPSAPADLDGPDFYSSLSLIPALPEEQLQAILDRETARMPVGRPDVVCFSIIDWDFRYQRPQQVMSQFAAHGHRVFYISTTRFQPFASSPRVTMRMIKERVYEVSLSAHHPPDVYGEVIEGENRSAILASLEELRRDFQINECIAYVMIASWGNVALAAQQNWGWRVLYDCMDNWEDFPGIKRTILDIEMRLVQSCDLLVVTGRRLHEKWLPYERPMIVARNAVDFEFYAQNARPNGLLSGVAHPIIGYFGAIADWFDVELLAYIAAQRPNYSFVLLGGIFDVDVSALRVLPNVHILGQQPYEKMPHYLHHFDVCLIPFKVNSITECTDPVKLYEYLSGGRPVVAVALPELDPYRELLYIAQDKRDFVTKLDLAVAENNPEIVSRRIALARENTWEDRYGQIEQALRKITSRASIVVVTHNNLVLTRLCLESLLRNTEYPGYEVIVVDNGSSDGTPQYLQKMAGQYPNISVILNKQNHGFARANNQGVAYSTGDYLILLNNDTVVPPGWLSRMLRHLRSPSVGMVGPVTNFVGNEAKVEVSYRTWAQMEEFARERADSFEGRVADMHMLAMFCVALRRATYNAVGPLDEGYGMGMFEDDDYAYRLRAKGYRLICAGDVFVHHFGQASFKELLKTGEYDALWERNRSRFEAKWNIKWIPHTVAPLAFHRFEVPPQQRHAANSVGGGT